MNSNPKISIIIPVFNRVHILEKTLSTIANQTLESWECIVVDDYSKEDVAFVVKSMNDSRFSYIKNKRTKGAPGARNTGIDSANGEYIVLFDSDNLMHQNFLNDLIEFAEIKKLDVVTCFARVVDSSLKQLDSFKWFCDGNIVHKLFTGECYVDNNIAIIRTEKLKEIGPNDEDCPAFQEWDTHIRLSDTCNYGTLEKELVDYVKGDEGTISGNTEKSAEGYLYILEKYLHKFKEHKSLIHHGTRILDAIEEIKDHKVRDNFIKKLNELIPNINHEIRKAKFKRAIVKTLGPLYRK